MLTAPPKKLPTVKKRSAYIHQKCEYRNHDKKKEPL